MPLSMLSPGSRLPSSLLSPVAALLSPASKKRKSSQHQKAHGNAAARAPLGGNGANSPRSPLQGGAQLAGRAAEVAAAAAQRVLLKEGTRLSVYWPGSEEWFETRVLGHRATVDPESGLLTFKHQCLYEGGNIEHDLGKTEYELAEPQPVDLQPDDAPAPASGAAPQSERERDGGQAMPVLSVGVAVSKKARLALRRAPKKGRAAAPKGKATKYASNAYGDGE